MEPGKAACPAPRPLRVQSFPELSCDERLPAPSPMKADGHKRVPWPSGTTAATAARTDEELRAAATVAVLAAKTSPSSPQHKRKRKRRVSESDVQVEALRPPRLSPEPEDNPEAVKKVREKNRLRMYRYTRNLEKQRNPGEDGQVNSSGAERSSPEVERKPKSRPPPLDTTETALAAAAKEERRASAQHDKPSPDASGASAEDHIPPSPTGHDYGYHGQKKDMPRLSPEPEDASPDELKRIKAKNRLRMYRWSMSQGLRQRQKPIKKRISSAGSDASLGDEVNDVVAFREAELKRSLQNEAFASLGMDASAVAAMVAAAQGTAPQKLSPRGQAAPVRIPRHSDPGAMSGASLAARKSKPPPAPPRLSPEPQDPSEAKKVRSKNRVRLHRWNQTVASSRSQDDDEPNRQEESAGVPFVHTSMGPPQQPHAMYSTQHGGSSSSMSLAALSSTVGAVDTLRHMLSGGGGFGQLPGNLDLLQQRASHHREASVPQLRKEIDISEAFCTSIQAPAFAQLNPDMKDIAMDTYVKETMGMANSLQALEMQLTASQATGSHGDPRSSALLAAVAQLRSDIWGLGQLRMAQYSGRSNQS